MYLKRLLFILCGAIFGILCLEWSLRIYIHSQYAVGTPFRDPSRYADPLTEDTYWMLWQMWNPSPSFTLDAELGWVGSFRPKTYLHDDRHTLQSRRPVILLGDSFSACVPEEKCFESLLENNPTFAKSHRLLNFGVGGYGLDQITLLLEKISPNYPDAIIIFGLMTLDIDRSHLRIRESSKPFFEVHQGDFHLRGTEENKAIKLPPFPNFSALFRLMLYSKAMPQFIKKRITSKTKRIAEKQKRSTYLLNRANSVLKHHEHHFLIFQPKSSIRTSTWREAHLKIWLEEHQKSSIWAKYLIVNSNPEVDLSKMFRNGDGHPTTRQNQLVSDAIANIIMRHPNPSP